MALVTTVGVGVFADEVGLQELPTTFAFAVGQGGRGVGFFHWGLLRVVTI
jgi:hypothetical protein